MVRQISPDAIRRENAGRKRGVEIVKRNTSRRNAARDRNFDQVIAPAIVQAFNDGVRFYWQLADWLNERRLLTWRGEAWTAQRVDSAFGRERRRILNEIGIKKGPRPCPICFMTIRTGCPVRGAWCHGRSRVGKRSNPKQVPRSERLKLLAAPRQALIGMNEEWRSDPRFGVEVSNRGRVRRRRILEMKLSPNGDPHVEIGARSLPVAYLVATNFHGAPLTRNETIQFLDGDRRNVDAANLGWSTRRQNTNPPPF
jgi:hypothetical protein